MSPEGLGQKCQELNKQYGYMHGIFVLAFLMSSASIYYFIISPVLKLFFGEELADFLQFAIILLLIFVGFSFKQKHSEQFLEFLYKRSKITLTIGTIFSLLVLRLKSSILNPLTPNNHE